MSNQVWSWILTVVGLTGFYFAGKKKWWCWYVNLACQVLWFIYAIASHQYGFIVASLAYSVLFTKNAVVWTREHREKQRIEKYSGLKRQNVDAMQSYAKSDVEKTLSIFKHDHLRPLITLRGDTSKFDSQVENSKAWLDGYERANPPLKKCSYEMRHTDEVGEIPVCVVHGQNSKYSEPQHLYWTDRPCLGVEPYGESNPISEQIKGFMRGPRDPK